ncbi:MAG: CBS domain-containing protein [Proteobacteria bacterium]|nr:CBS domain-containing protein [Pseudomonadota bacterium]
MPDPTPIQSSRAPPAVLPPRLTSALPRLKGESPALAAMTDFTHDNPAIVAPGRHIDDALRDMIAYGVRALLVVEDGKVLGLITASDIMGERPIKFLQNPLCEGSPCRHKDIHVADIMTPWAELQLIDYDWVSHRATADIAETLIRTCATHLLVVERSAQDTGSTLRGLFSRTRLERQLDHALTDPC